MKNDIKNVKELTEAKDLLASIEGGTLGDDIFYPTPFPGPVCNFLDCSVPMYGVITDPRWNLKK